MDFTIPRTTKLSILIDQSKQSQWIQCSIKLEVESILLLVMTRWVSLCGAIKIDWLGYSCLGIISQFLLVSAKTLPFNMQIYVVIFNHWKNSIMFQLVLNEKGFLSRHKTIVLHQGEGPIRSIKWKAHFIAWANDVVCIIQIFFTIFV